MKIDPIIAVRDVEQSSKWYQSIFGWTSMHGGSQFDVLVAEKGEVMLCLHRWGAHDHPTMRNLEIIPGNGLILYFRTVYMEEIRQNLRNIDHPVEAEIQLNTNSHRKEFSLVDPIGYYLTISEHHTYEG